MSKEITPPIAKKENTVLKQHGEERVDPYFWMRLTDEQKEAENPDEQTKRVIDYLKAENEYTKAQLSKTTSLQEKLYTEIIGRIKQDDQSVPYFSNGYWYYARFEEGKEYPIICRKEKSLEHEEEVILNANEEAEGHAFYQLGSWHISPDSRILAFNEDTLSRRIYKIRFKDLSTGKYLADELANSDGDGAWAKDSKTFFYTTKNKTSLLSENIVRHQLGTKNEEDCIVYHEKDPSFYIGVYTSKSKEYIIIYNSSTLVSDYWILRTDDPLGEFVSFSPRGTKHEYSIDHYQDKFYIVTNWEAENFRLMETPQVATSQDNWKEVIPHREEVLIDYIEVFKDHLVIAERFDALTHLRIINQQTQESHYITFEEPAYVVYSGNNPEFDTPLLRFGYGSLTTPNSVYDYNMDTRERELKKQEEIVGGHKPEEYVTERHFVTSRDGVKIPISLVYKKGLKRDANNPTLLYAYGSYGSSSDPSFASHHLSLLDRGFVWCIAHVRGGQEMGRKWYESGKMFQKINTFNDYVDCAKFLIAEKITSNNHLYGYGGSAGGLLIGAVANRAPEYFNGLIAAVPFVDVVSTMLDESIPLTTNEFDEWGNPKNEDSYRYMLSYSPYDQVKAQSYPHLLVTTGLFDSQVQYWEPAKWVAKLRDMKTDDHLLLLRTDMESGHGGASGRFKRFKDRALDFAFLLSLEDIYD